MKKIIFTLLAINIALISFAQTHPVNLTAKVIKDYGKLKEGDQIHIKGVEYARAENE